MAETSYEPATQASQIQIIRHAKKLMGRYRARLYLLFLFLLLTMGGVGYLVLSAQQNQENQIARLELAYDQLQLLDALLLGLVDAETGERGFIITGQEEFLQSYHTSMARMDDLLRDLRRTVPEGLPNASRMNDLETTARQIRSLLEQVVATRRAEGEDAAREMVRSQVVKKEMDRFRTLISEWMEIESEELADVSREVERASELTQTSTVVGFSLSGIFLLLTMGLIRRETKRREKMLVELTESRDGLESALAQQRVLLAGRERLRSFTEALQGCRTLEEAQEVLAFELPELLGVPNGALAIQNASRVYLEVVRSWGPAESHIAQVFEPDDCYSLRRGGYVWCDDPTRELCCPHLKKSHAVPTICYPLTAHNQVLGCLVLWGDQLSRSDPEQRDLLGFAAETFSVVLSNLKLDESLRFQAVRDPLTGLYNRRHMEVSLERELARAKRGGEPLVVMMADIDHFKSYNDTQGHDAADKVLSTVGQILLANTRVEDVACRYGGEEFLLILSGIDLERAAERVEAIRAEVGQVRCQFRGETLPGVTLSAGIAAFPGDGASAEMLIQAADRALYRAKRNGRNRVEIAGSSAARGVENEQG